MLTDETLTEDGLTFDEIAKALNISPSRVRQIEMRALMKLRTPALKEKWQNILETAAAIRTKKSY